MKVAAIVIGMLTILLTACGGRSVGDQEKDQKLIAAAIQAVDGPGGKFNMSETITFSGGDIKNGPAVLKTEAAGVVKEGNAQMTFSFLGGQGGRSRSSFDLMIVNAQLYTKPQGTDAWRTAPSRAVNPFYSGVRLSLIREAVLLAKTTSSGFVTHIDSGFVTKYTVTPAPDQLEQLQSMQVQGAQETTFLKTAKASIDVFLSYPGSRLQRVDVHLSGVDPVNGTTQKVDSAVNFKYAAKTGTIVAPEGAQPVQLTDIFAPKPPGS